MPEVVSLKDWYPQMADKWIDRLASLERQGVKVIYEPNERRGWVIHHTVGGAATDPRRYARLVADMHWDKWLRPGGYNFLVGTDGRIREMSGLLHVGAHSGTHEWNRASLGLAFQGDFRQRAPSDSMLDAAREFMASVPVSEDQWTHREVRPEPTTCPGDALTALLPLQLPEEDPVSLPVNAQSGKEEIRHVQEMLGVAATGEWDFPDALEGLRDRSGTGDTRDHVNGRMYTQLLGEFVAAKAPQGASSSHDHDGRYIRDVTVSR